MEISLYAVGEEPQSFQEWQYLRYSGPHKRALRRRKIFIITKPNGPSFAKIHTEDNRFLSLTAFCPGLCVAKIFCDKKRVDAGMGPIGAAPVHGKKVHQMNLLTCLKKF